MHSRPAEGACACCCRRGSRAAATSIPRPDTAAPFSSLCALTPPPAPPPTQKYEIQDITAQQARANINSLFRRFSGVDDVSVAEVLRQKGIMDLDEANRMFKTRSHVYKTIMEAAPPADESRFLDTFFKGTA